MINRRQMMAAVAVAPSALVASIPSSDPIIVTGDLGVVGSKLTPVLDGLRLVGIDRKRGSHENLSIPRGEWVDKLGGARAVIHLAWEIIWDNPNAWDLVYQQAAIDATLNLYEACRLQQVPLIVLGSTKGVRLKPGDPPGALPHGPLYAAAKRFAEDALQVMATENGIAAVAVRIGRVSPPDSSAGPDDDLKALFSQALYAPSGYSIIEV